LVGIDFLSASIEWMTFVVSIGWFNLGLRAWRAGATSDEVG
jgi:hypothetical protein